MKKFLSNISFLETLGVRRHESEQISSPGIMRAPKKIFRKEFRHKKGFTLVEIMVAISVFTIVMFISMGSILSIVAANRKSQSLRAVMDNMNSTLESMTRTIRFGTNYHCGTTGTTSLPQDCGGSGGNALTVRSPNGDQVTYTLVSGRIARSINGAANYYITSPDVTINKLNFWVYGSLPYSAPDYLQPQAIIVVGGFAGTQATSQSTFTLETTVSQRIFDFQ